MSVNEMCLFKTFLVVLVKTECMMASKVVAIWIKTCFVSLIRLNYQLLIAVDYIMYVPLCTFNKATFKGLAIYMKQIL